MRTAGIVIVAIAIVVSGYFLYNRYSSRSSNNTTINNTYDNTETASKAKTQAANNKKGLMLQSVNLPQAGFLVIQQDNKGQPGNVLGTSALLNSGASQNVQISAPLNPGQTYFITAYADTDQGKTFNSKIDMPLKDSSGKVLRQQFTAPNS